MCKITKILILILFCSLTISSNISFSQTQNEALFDILQTSSDAFKQKQVTDLRKYNNWWNSLSPKQKQIAYFVDGLEQKFKNVNNGMPINNDYSVVKAISTKLKLRSQSDIAVVEDRLEQHMNEYDDIMKLDEINRGYEKLKKKIEETPEG